MSNDKKSSDLPKHSESQPGASVLLRSGEDGDVTLSFSDGSEPLTMNRRDFMRVSGAAAATAAMTTAACREPTRHIVPYVDRPEDVRIGHPSHYASVCNACPSQCGVIVKSRAGRPFKLEGNPDHPVSQGGLCGRGQASYLDLYDPDRLRHPTRGDDGAELEELDWEEVDAEVQEHVQGLRDGDGLRILTGARSGFATRGLIDDIVDSLPDAAHYIYEPLAEESAKAAAETSYGEPHVPTYRFDRAEFIVSLGSDFLGTWLSPVEFTRQFAAGRDLFDSEEEFDEARREYFRDQVLEEHDGDIDDAELQKEVHSRMLRGTADEDFDYEFAPSMNRLVAFESSLTLTGVNADYRYKVRPDALVYVALALAHELFENHSPGGLPPAAVEDALADFDVESVAEYLGEPVDADALRDVAAQLAEHAGSCIVMAGGVASATDDGIALESAVNLINAALENDGETVDRTRPSHQSPGGSTELQALVDDIEAGDVDVLIIDGTNPVYSSPEGIDFAAALQDVPYVISTADRIDETAVYADVVATGCHYLEQWGDSHPRADVFAIRQPAILPLYETRSFENSLLHWFGDDDHPELAAYLEGPDEPNPIGDRHGKGKPYDPGPFFRYLRDYWEGEIYQNFDAFAGFDAFWEQVLRDGFVVDENRTVDPPSIDISATVALLPDDLPDAPDVDYGDIGDKVVHLFPTIPMFDGRHANNGHLQEMPDPITKHTWGSFAMVGYRTFQAAGLESGQLLEVQTEAGQTLTFPVIPIPGMHEDIIALPLGYGRNQVGVVGDDVGQNAFSLARSTDDGTVYSGLTPEIRVTDTVEELSVIKGAGVVDVDKHRILATATLDEYADDQRASVYRTPYEEGGDKPPSLWPDHDFGDLKWGMSIDMTKCTGCSACMIACQEENNIPVVGREGILEGREMHWLRLDRYYRLPEEAAEAREGLTGDPMYNPEPVVGFGEYLDEPRVVMQPMLCQHCDKAPCESVCPVVATMQSNDGLNQMAYNRCVGTRYCANNCPYKVRRYNWFNYAENREDSVFARFYPELKEHGRLNQTEPLQLAFNPDVTVRSRGVMEKCTFCVQRIRRGKWDIMKEGRRTFEDGEVITACQESCPADAIEFGNLMDDEHKVARIHKRKRAMAALADLDTRPAVAYLTSIWNTDEELA